jgi:hypothetical protein
MLQNSYNNDAFISASTIIDVGKEMINAYTDTENKNGITRSHPELFY